jgi:hypothetical protein
VRNVSARRRIPARGGGVPEDVCCDEAADHPGLPASGKTTAVRAPATSRTRSCRRPCSSTSTSTVALMAGRDHWRIIGVFDDRRQVVRMWRALGLTVFQVAEGYF